MMKGFIGEPIAPPHHHHHEHGPIEIALVANASAYARLFTKLTQHVEDDTRHITDDERKKWNGKADEDALNELKSKVTQLTTQGIPTALSQLTNDVGYITSASLPDLSNYITWQSLNLMGLSDYAKKSDLNDYVLKSQLGSYLTAQDLDGYATRTWVLSQIEGLGGNGGGTTYTLPAATSNTLGGIKIGFPQSGKSYPVQLNENQQAYVTVPWQSGEGGSGSGSNGGHYEIIFKTVEGDNAPALPTNFDVNPDGWKHYADNADSTHSVWMANRWIDGNTVAGAWMGPWRISGANGENGIDGDSFEYIYYLTTSEDTTNVPSLTNTIPATDSVGRKPEDDDFVPQNWKDNPTGVDSVNRFEWMAFRQKQHTTQHPEGVWSNFVGPILWSAYGRNGTDGDGVQYIYFVTNSATSPSNDQDPSQWPTNTEEYQNGNHNGEYYINGWTDDPANMQLGDYTYVSVRKRKDGLWQAYSTPVVWSHYSKDGRDGVDGVGTGVTLDSDNDMMAIIMTSDGYNALEQVANISMYATGQSEKLLISSLEIVEVKFSDGTAITNHDYLSIGGDSTHNDWKLNVNIPSGNTIPFNNRTMYITLQAEGTVQSAPVIRRISLKIVPITVGQEGADGVGYSLQLDSKVIRINKNNQKNPSTIIPCMIETTGKNSIKTYYVVANTGESVLPNSWTIQYRADSDNDWITANTRSIDVNGVTNSIEIRLQYSNTTVDQERVFVISDGKDGANGANGTNGMDGVSGSGYVINVDSSSLAKTKDGSVYKLTGSLYYKATYISGITRTEITDADAINSDYRTSVTIGGVVVSPAPQYSDTSRAYYINVNKEWNDAYKFAVIKLTDKSGSLLSSCVVPISIPGNDGADGADGKDGKDGKDGGVQALNANVTRIRNYEKIDGFVLYGLYGNILNPIVRTQSDGTFQIYADNDEDGDIWEYDNTEEPVTPTDRIAVENAILTEMTSRGYNSYVFDGKYYQTSSHPTIYRDPSTNKKLNIITPYNDGTVPEDGIYYTDVVAYGINNDGSPSYYRCIKYGTPKTPTNSNGDVNSDSWSLFAPSGEAAFDYLLSRSAYIQDLTAKNVVVTNESGNVVAGMTSGNKIPTELNGTTNNDGIRIWAGPIDSSGNIANAPFTVDNNGRVTMLNADVSGSISSDNFETELFEDKQLMWSNSTEPEVTLYAGKYNGVTGGFRIGNYINLFVNGIYVGHITTENHEIYGFGKFQELTSSLIGDKVTINYSEANNIRTLTIKFKNIDSDNKLYVKMRGIKLQLPNAGELYDVFEIAPGSTVTYTYNYKMNDTNVATNWNSGVRASVYKIGTFVENNNPSNARPNDGFYWDE